MTGRTSLSVLSTKYDMSNIGSLSVRMALESAQFINGMKAAAAQSQATNAAISKAMSGAKAAVGGLAAAMSIDAFVSASKAAFDYADDIVDLADRTGATTKSIQELRYAAQMTGSDMGSADSAIEKFAKNLGGAQNGSDALAGKFAALGVTSGDFNEALRQTIDGISKLPTVTQRNATALEIFGKAAGNLTALMGEGTKGFDEFAKSAQDLGIVLGDDLLRKAGQINDRLDTLKMILDAKFAGAIIQNADAIGNLADSTVKLVGALASFWGQNPTGAMAVMGALAGGTAGAMVGGLPGAAVGGVLGAAGGAYAGSELRGNRQKLTDERAGLIEQNRKKGNWLGIGDLPDDAPQRKKNDARIKAINGQLAAMDKAAAAQAAALKLAQGGGKGTDTPNLPTPKSKPAKSSGKSAEDLAKEAAEKMAAYLSDLSSSTVELLSAKQALTNDILDQSAYEREILEITTSRRKAAIDQDVTSGKYTKAQGDELKALEDKISYEKGDLINRRENETLAKDSLSLRLASNDNERDLLSSTQSLARTQGERRAISLRLIDLQYEQLRLQSEAIVASKDSTQAEKDIAAARLAVLDKLKSNDVASVKRDTMGPMASYLDSIPKTGDEIRESMESAAIDGLGSLNDGLKEAIRGTGSLGDAFEAVGDRIIDKLLDIAIEQAVIAPLGELFGSVLGSIGTSLFGGVKIGARANGGYTPAGSYLVGERGPELINVGANASTIPNHALRNMSGNSSGPVIHIGNITSNDPEMVRAMVYQGIAQAAPMLSKNGSDRTMSKLRRPTL